MFLKMEMVSVLWILQLVYFFNHVTFIIYRRLQRALTSLQAQAHLEEQLGASEIIPYFR